LPCCIPRRQVRLHVRRRSTRHIPSCASMKGYIPTSADSWCFKTTMVSCTLGKVYSNTMQISRLIYFSPIGTHAGRGTLKKGCFPWEHAIVYLSGTDPETCYLPGEYESGMVKQPIEIVPVDSSITLRSESRIRFGKTYPIEKNVKVKDIGMVHPNHLGKLSQYWTDRSQAQS
jgi:hypothetical protein